MSTEIALYIVAISYVVIVAIFGIWRVFNE